MAADLLGLFEAHGLAPKKKTGGEWAAPCPACGGEDRCMIKPADHEGRGGYWCRQCGAYGDAIQFLRDYEGMSYVEACRHLGIEAARATASSLPRPPKPSAGQGTFEAAPSVPPAELWTQKATDFAAWAHQQLLASPKELAWLAARGLPLEAVQRYRLGWNPGEKGRSCLIRPRARWGLPPVEGKPDKSGKPTLKKTFWIPRGLVIPHFAGTAPDSPVARLRIRRPEADRREFRAETKYYVIPGSNMDAMILGRDARAFVVVESELDALMLHHVAGDLAGAVSVMTASVRKIEAGVLETLHDALAILVALDAEGKDGAGAKGCARWMASFPRAKRWPVPVGKDPGEAFEKGANLRAWILAGLPAVLRPGLLPPGQPRCVGAGEEEAARGGAVENAPAATEDARASVPDVPQAREDAPTVRWLDPDHVTAFELVPLRELLEAMARYCVEPVLVPGRDSNAERLLALRVSREVPAAECDRIAGMFFGACLEAVLWFADYRGMRSVEGMRGVFGRSDGNGQVAAIVRRADPETANLSFAGWARLDFWRCPEAA
ncbi:P4 alpha zinc-binding domain protein [Solidesulfovibrio fructosivorans JJ]]|uniref:p4 alpha zinc-binding domain protein n=2 Tax=Solidesulfovibrio fructosivorans TaxID=878 RepID=E1JR30_SOLFR|nr:P4 alpha zinc-binding domain protein [Solidesulfovibrio fructosivorans JJ]]